MWKKKYIYFQSYRSFMLLYIIHENSQSIFWNFIEIVVYLKNTQNMSKKRFRVTL